MNCLNCGSPLPDDATKCDVCGLKVPGKSPSAAVQRLKMLGLGVGIGLVVVGAVAIPAFMGSASAASAPQSSHVASDLVTQGEIVVPVQASGLDVSGSRVAVHAKGRTSGGVAVEKDGYVNHEGKGLSLEQGTYEVTAVGSPISSSGVIYNLPTTSVSIEITAEGGSSYTSSASLTLSPIDAASVTDEQIEAARQWVLNDPERASSADQLAGAARQRRAAAQKAAEGAKKEKEGKQEDAESQSDQSNQSNQSDQSSHDSSDSSGQYDYDSSGQSNYSNYNNYDGNYASSQSYSGGSAPVPSQDSGSSAQAPSADSQPAESSSDAGGQQVDPAPPDGGSGGSGSSDTGGGSGSDQGSTSSPVQPSGGETNASGSASTTTG